MKYISFLFLACLLYSHLVAQTVFVQTGEASYYADRFEGEVTASGETFHQDQLTGAHLTLPFGSMVKVTNLENNRSIVVRINDRGPFVEGRIIDLTHTAAQMLGFAGQGTAKVRIELLSEPSVVSNEVTETSASPEEFYRISATAYKPRGFGVQIGSFQDLSNLMRLMDKLQARDREKIIIRISTVNNIRVYRAIVGEYEKREDAERKKAELFTEFPDAFISLYPENKLH